MSVQTELHNLLDQAVDDRLGASGYAELDALLLKDSLVCQSAVEFLDLDLRIHEWNQDLAAVDYVERLLSQKQLVKRNYRKIVAWAASLSTVAMLFVAVLSVIYFNNLQKLSEPLGRITALSEDVKWAHRDYVSGDLIRIGDPLEVLEGFATIETNLGVLIDLSPETEVNFKNENELYLHEGALSAFVPPRGVGFTVKTEDAKIVDHGTEFVVEKKATLGTTVAVSQGNVECFLLDASGNTTRVLDLTANSGAKFDYADQLGETFGGFAQMFQRFKQSQKIRYGIKHLEGQTRYAIAPPADLSEGAYLTRNYALLVAEKSGVVLQEDISFQSINGQRTIPAGSVVDSYLLHYEPTDNITRAGIGTIVFHQNVAAIIVDTEALGQTDSLFSIPKTRFSKKAFRGAESSEDGDRIELDNSGRSLFFHFDMEPGGYLDQVRIIVHHQ